MTPNHRCTLRVHPHLDLNWTGNSELPILVYPRCIPFRSYLVINSNLRGKENNKLTIIVAADGSDPYKLVNEIANIFVNLQEEFEVYLSSNSILDCILLKLEIKLTN
jgi:hypothetical protein